MYANSRQKEVIELFKTGLTAEQIAETLAMSKYNVWKYARRLGLKFSGKGSSTKTFILDNPFKYHTEASDYWLGMLVADGGLRKKRNSGSFHLGLIDYDHMVKYQKFLNWPEPPKMHKNRTTYGIVASHKETFNYLLSIGITPNKSKTIKLTIPLNRHILRGIFDGDGYAPRQGERKAPKITLASIELCKDIQGFLKNNNITSSITHQQVYKETITYALNISMYDICTFYNLMYDKCAVFLERKHTKMRHLSEMVNEKRGELLGNPTDKASEGNQQPSLNSNILEGSTTNLQVPPAQAEDSNEDKSALHLE
jgi:hypothetical protein